VYSKPSLTGNATRSRGLGGVAPRAEISLKAICENDRFSQNSRFQLHAGAHSEPGRFHPRLAAGGDTLLALRPKLKYLTINAKP